MSKRAIAYRLTVFHCHREEVCVRATRVYINAECISKKLMVASVLECPRRLFQRNLSEPGVFVTENLRKEVYQRIYIMLYYIISTLRRGSICASLAIQFEKYLQQCVCLSLFGSIV